MESQLTTNERTETYWFIEPEYTIAQFTVKTFLFFTVTGRFTDVAGTLVFRESEIHCSSIETTIKAASIDTGNRRRDEHLRSKEFLAVETYPEISFRSASVRKGRDRDALVVTGTLTVKGVSREVVLAVTEVDRSRSPQGEEIAYYSATTEIDRHHFGVSHWRWLIGGKLKITIHVQAQKQASIRL